MIYHDLLNLTNPLPAKNLNQLHTGYYRFYFGGGEVVGNVRRIGDKTLLVDIAFVGLREIGVMEFLDSQPVKI